MKSKLRFYNTLSRKLEDFVPLNEQKIGVYTCGPTVYSYAHIGNMRAYIFSDTLRRVLEYFGYPVKHVMNITDVGHLTDDADAGEDKLEVEARREGVDAWGIANKYTEVFFEHTDLLNIKKPEIICKATDHIKEQIDMVKVLEEKGFTYKTSDGIYFDTKKFPSYAKFAQIDVDGLQSGHRIEVGEKRNKTDFALWKFSKPQDRRAMEWDSPWGRGFPGWHIECSAMSMKYLGEQFDIHTGGVDHIQIHHSNEIAQSECTTGKSPFVKYWLHNEFLIVDDAPKMSKSLGNIITVGTLKDKGFNPLSYRLLCLQSHYRKQLKFTYDNLVAAQTSYERLHQAVSRIKKDTDGEKAESLTGRAAEFKEKLDEALGNDMNMPKAFANLCLLVEDKQISAFDKLALVEIHDALLGLRLLEDVKQQSEIPEEIQKLLQARNTSRSEKNWKEADRLRDEILSKGYEILDSAQGSTVKRKL